MKKTVPKYIKKRLGAAHLKNVGYLGRGCDTLGTQSSGSFRK